MKPNLSWNELTEWSKRVWVRKAVIRYPYCNAKELGERAADLYVQAKQSGSGVLA